MRLDPARMAKGGDSWRGRMRPGVGSVRGGFTLLELLVVTVIIGILAGFMLPAFHVARERGRAALCRGNLRQLAIGAIAYTEEHNGFFPPAFSGSVKVDGETVQRSWDFDIVGGKARPGVIFGEYCNSRVFQCPSYKGGSQWMAEHHTGYNYNTSYIGHGVGEVNPRPARLVDVQSPMQCALFGDGEYGGGANKFMRAPFNDPAHGGDVFSGRTAGTQGFRHLGSTHIAFCDGHVESLPDCYTKTASHEIPAGPDTGFISEDNSLYDLH